MLHGIDVWHGNGTIDWPEVKSAGTAFSFVRAAYGDVQDKRVLGNLKDAREAGIPVGVYHFLRTSRDYQQQIDLMLDLIDRLELGPGDLPPALDVEDNPKWDGPWQAARTDKYLTAVDRWITAVKARTGAWPVLYTRAEFWNTLGNPGGFSHCPLWVAHYGVSRPRLPAGWTDYAFWQYTETGAMQGIESKVDLNRFSGDTSALASLLLK